MTLKGSLHFKKNNIYSPTMQLFFCVAFLTGFWQNGILPLERCFFFCHPACGIWSPIECRGIFSWFGWDTPYNHSPTEQHLILTLWLIWAWQCQA